MTIIEKCSEKISWGAVQFLDVKIPVVDLVNGLLKFTYLNKYFWLARTLFAGLTV